MRADDMTLSQLLHKVPEHMRPVVAQTRNAKARLDEIGNAQLTESRKMRNGIVKLYSSGLSVHMVSRLIGLSYPRTRDLLVKEMGSAYTKRRVV